MNVSQVRMINAEPTLFALVTPQNRMTIAAFVTTYKMMNSDITESSESLMMSICSSLVQNGIDKFKSTVSLDAASRLAELWVNAEISNMNARDISTMIDNIATTA
tara:strand:+ start:1071 stop:1385 length:315 start_codon:yes stop_codon:yes gene_type:complete